MTIQFEGLSGTDRAMVTLSWGELMRTLGSPRTLNPSIDAWFGTNCPAPFRANIERVMSKFRSCMNLCTITVCCAEFGDRDVDTFGAAYHNTDTGFAEIINFDAVSQPKLRLELDSRWNIGVNLHKTPTDFDSGF
jgi:hypothetical protein